eukprot:CAMPEP_0198645806 /NCGR_PEP_ID=MMETSP1467-20131203/1437_1 /TAXON_ID=1462469 /ORGANISM="unid. sp., Strain CCMP2135" /LENGTH=168 /DNA_ID=CAMNT_0044381303 /DNA_START=37 /DNA_END=543 /DNA_ORIENTATION=+
MALCCLGPVCVPYTAIWPLLVFLAKYIWDHFGSLIRRVLGFEAKQQEEATKIAAPDVPSVESAEAWKKLMATTGRPVVVDFGAEWCKPCKKIAPFFCQLAAECGDGATFAKVDIDDQAEIATEANVLAVPTFQVFVNGMPVDQLQGADTAALRALVEKHASTNSNKAA